MNFGRRDFAVGLAGLGGLAALGPFPQTARRDLYACEGCEAVSEHGAAPLASTTRLAPPGEPGEAMVVMGRVFAVDGVTPAPGVVVYAHHTNVEGLYANGRPDTESSRRHGRLRGWVRTDRDGRYRFDTIKPAPYPDRNEPAHVHLMIGEAGRRPYYIDNVVFEGEFGVDQGYRARQELRGGSGIVALRREAAGLIAVRDIRLERHPSGA